MDETERSQAASYKLQVTSCKSQVEDFRNQTPDIRINEGRTTIYDKRGDRVPQRHEKDHSIAEFGLGGKKEKLLSLAEAAEKAEFWPPE